MQKITPFLWFNDNAEEAINHYISIFENSRIVNASRYGDTGPGPKGTIMVATFELDGYQFMALNGGPMSTISPAISFFVSRKTEQDIDKLWAKLSEGGQVFMGLDKYPFSEKFGWIQDKFGVSWQLNLARDKKGIAPFLLYVGTQHGRAEEAVKFYASVIKNSSVIEIVKFSAGEHEKEGTVKQAKFTLQGQEFIAMESGMNHAFTFTPGLSLLINRESQAEIDDLWEKLSEGGAKDRCGWLRDKFGVSWQIVPTILGRLMQDQDPEKSKRVMMALMQMAKLEIKGLQDAYDGK